MNRSDHIWVPKYRTVKVGDRFGRLVVIALNDAHPWTATCRCDCGNIKSLPDCRLRRAHSCGCFEIESRRKAKKHGHSRGQGTSLASPTY